MSKRRLWIAVVLAVATFPALGGPPVTVEKNSAPVKDSDRDVLALAAKIDRHIAARWEEDKVQAAPPADDAEFLRRVSLDIVGRIPSVAEVREFLEDASADKRLRVVEKLLASPGYVQNFTNIWRRLMIPENDADFQIRQLAVSFEAWLRKQLSQNAPYDKMVRELLTTPLGSESMGRAFGAQQAGEPTPVAFYQAKMGKPENLAASTARLFLGIRLECAQCHNHPFATWKREQFWEFAAFFAGMERQGDGAFVPIREMSDRTELLIPETKPEQVVQASFLDGTEPDWKYKVTARVILADWMASPQNPFFARAAVNRMWSHFFGIGITEPADDMEGEQTPSHPDLLNELAREFAAHKFDLKFLIRAITASRAYQLSSAIFPSPPTPLPQGERGGKTENHDPRWFGRMAVKGLTAEQIFDSISVATGYRDGTPAAQPVFVLNNTPRADFLAKFAEQGDKRTEVQTSILQALALMNGSIIGDATSLQRSETLAAVADAPFMSDAERVETLFLATLSRKPKVNESARLVKYVESGGAAGDRKKALADVFWALLNCGEFILNH